MRLREFDESANSALKLAALSQFLSDRAEDEAASKQISQAAFIDLAQSLDVNVTDQNLGGIVRFKGNTEATTGMSVDQAREVVDSNAKAAMKRRQ